MKIEEKFRYAEWKITLTKDENGNDVYVFEPKNKEKYKSHLVGALRREYQYRTNVTKYSNVEQIEEAMKSISVLAKQIDVDNIEEFHANKVQFEKSSKVVNTMVYVYKKLTKNYYFECNLHGLTVNEIIKMYVFLYTFSQIYIVAVEKKFNQEDESTYKYLVPVIGIDYLVDEFSRLYAMQREKSKKY